MRPVCLFFCLFAWTALSASASLAATVVVPDDFATIQEAIDSPAESVLVRSGDYPERVTMRRENVWQTLLAAHPDNATSGRPRVGALLMYQDWPCLIRGCEISGGVYVRSDQADELGFEDCRLDSGVIQIAVGDAGNPPGLTLKRCFVRGNVSAIVANGRFDGDTLVGGGLVLDGESGISVKNCVFRGDGSGTAILLQGYSGQASIHDNQFEDFGAGIATSRAGHEFTTHIQRNVFRRCGYGVAIGGQGFVVADNEVRNCGTGISVLADRSAVIRGNRVLGSETVGISMRVESEPSACHSNVVGRSGTNGLRFDVEDYTSVDIRMNTVYQSGSDGIWIATDGEPGDDYPTFVHRNVVYASRGYGLVWVNPIATNLGCNDWFGNQAGATSGVSPAATDLAVDPLFCDVTQDEIGLRADSPLLSARDCEPIGAKGPGCDALTEVQVALLVAERYEDGVRIHWRLGGDETPTEVWIERAEADAGPWRRIATERARQGDAAIDWDRDTGAAERSYRLGWIAAGGTGHSPAVEVPSVLPLATAFALRVIGPNPTNGPVDIEYALPRESAIELGVHDVLGREVARLASGVTSAGRHRARWSGAIRGGAANPGLYFVRLRHPEGERTGRILIRR